MGEGEFRLFGFRVLGIFGLGFKALGFPCFWVLGKPQEEYAYFSDPSSPTKAVQSSETPQSREGVREGELYSQNAGSQNQRLFAALAARTCAFRQLLVSNALNR